MPVTGMTNYSELFFKATAATIRYLYTDTVRMFPQVMTINGLFCRWRNHNIWWGMCTVAINTGKNKSTCTEDD